MQALFCAWLQQARQRQGRQEEDGRFVDDSDSKQPKGVVTYLATLVEIKLDLVVEVPDEVTNVLKEFGDVMPSELPKFLPPHRVTEDKIDLVLGVEPPVKVPYRMCPSELVELRKQLTELLDAGLVQPSKAPYGAPTLFQKK